ncbi:uncharacterized protein LOC144343246 [Saccoglossus kowalevskii]
MTLRSSAVSTRHKLDDTSDNNGATGRENRDVSCEASGGAFNLADVMGEIRNLRHEITNSITKMNDGMKILSNEVRDVSSKVNDNSEQVSYLQGENERLSDRSSWLESELDNMKAQMKRNNLIFYGIEQSSKETWDDTEKNVKNFLQEKLGIADNEIEFQRVHRLTYSRTQPKPIIANLLRYKQRMMVIRAASKLKGTSFRIGEDYTLKVREIRRKLGKHADKARDSGKAVKCLYDKIKIDDEIFIYDENQDTIRPLRPRKKREERNDNR